ncbi:MAG: diguanylate cyclase domain-containing protein [Chitinophagales bacterium]
MAEIELVSNAYLRRIKLYKPDPGEVKPLILVVDDDRLTRTLVRERLESESYRVIEASNGLEGLSKYTKFNPDMVLLDAVMPVMDGFAACRQIRESPGGLFVPILMLTTLADDRSVSLGFEAGVNDFINKPVNWTLLLHRVHRLLQEKKAQQELTESETFLHDIINLLPDPTFAINNRGEVIIWNQALENMTGVIAKDILGKNNFEHSMAIYGRRVPVLTDLVLSPNTTNHHYEKLVRYAGSITGEGWVKAVYNPTGLAYVWGKATYLRDSQGQIIGAIETFRDMTERKLAEETQNRLTAIIEATPNLVGTFGLDGKLKYLNDAARATFGIGESQDLSKVNIGNLYPEWAFDIIVNKAYPTAIKEGSWKGETAILDVTGREIPLLQALISHCKPDGSVAYLSSIAQDITELKMTKQMEDRLHYLSLHDVMTGIYNRAYFEEEMRRLESGRFNPVGLIMCDLNGLKFVNDTLGHEVGDDLLKNLALIIKSCFRESDVVARVGGDEFGVLLPNTPRVLVEEACQRIRNAVANSNIDAPIPLNIAIGFAVRQESTTTLSKIYKEADNDMHRQKLNNRNSTRSALVKILLKALEARDFITEGHAERLQYLVYTLGCTIGLADQDLNNLRLLAQFHDIGKVGIPDRILFKAASLTSDEHVEMQKHCEIGYRIALTAPDLAPIAEWILKHHEWWNGNGYPLGLKEEDIPMECRLLAIADAFDAMTSDRPYRHALTINEAIQELKRCSGSQFDPLLVECFINSIVDDKSYQS